MKKNILLCLSFLFFLSTLASCQQQEGYFLNKKVIKKIYPSIVEVVIPKQEDEDIIYQRPLPFDQLDYKQRTDKFYAIGTAFFISEKRLISAAHVFPADIYSTYKDYKVRTNDGEVYEIGKLYRYSTYRDLIEFELKEYPKEITPLVLQSKVEIGDMVYTVGNAGGEGISTRGGQVSTFTPEPVSGLWDYIRFSSPASPGNSGGPLVNYKGEVVGIIVMKNNSENLNFALPVDQIKKTSSTEATFLTRKLKVQDAMQVLTKDWKFTTPLPSSLLELRSLAIPNRDEFFSKLITEFKENFSPLVFPNNKRFRDSLLYQPLFSRLSSLEKDQALLEWKLSPIALKKIVVTKDDILYHAKGTVFENMILFLPQKDQDPVSLIKQPRSLLNRALKASGANRYMAAQRIPIEDHGEPDQSFYWKDDLGRAWYTSRWEVLYSDSIISTHCSPTPEGAYCFIDHSNSEQKYNGYMHFVRENIVEINLSYKGNLEQWLSFQNIEKKFLPISLRDLSINVDKKNLNIDLNNSGEQLHFTIERKRAESENFRLSALISYNPASPLALSIQGIEILLNKNSSRGFNIYKSYAAQASAPDEAIERWNNISSRLGLYNGQVHVDNDQNLLFKPIGDNRREEELISSINNGVIGKKPVKRQWMFGCYGPSTLSRQLMKNECLQQLNKIQLK